MHIFFFFNDTATTEIYPLSLHDALPISSRRSTSARPALLCVPLRITSVMSRTACSPSPSTAASMKSEIGSGLNAAWRSEEHTSELQSRQYLVCRLLLEKKKEQHDERIIC